MNGIINVYKEKGYTSHDAVAKLRGILHQKKIGHTGTLDPDAEGVLPVCLGKATKVCSFLTEKDKVYETVLRLGITTDTLDMSGRILKKVPIACEKEEIIKVISSFTGTIEQIPPMYSAIKINGKKLYELAREGKEIERKPRTVMIHDISILEFRKSEETMPVFDQVVMRVSCSKGTYIRSLCDDIGKKLSCGGCMENLLRIQSGIFTIEHSLRLDEIEQLLLENRLQEKILPVDKIFADRPARFIKEEYKKNLYNGNLLTEDMFCQNQSQKIVSGEARVYDPDSQFIGLYQLIENEQRYKPVKMFW